MALYEQKGFVQGQIGGVKKFDQWGVEVGKTLGEKVHSALSQEGFIDEKNQFDSSTLGLINAFNSMKDKL